MQVDPAVGVDGGMVDEDVPRMVGVFEWRLAGEVVACGGGLGSALP